METPPQDPSDGTLSSERKPSVSFDIPNSERPPALNIKPFEKPDNPQSPSSPHTPIDITCQQVPSELLVALVERQAEMRELFELNKDFFDLVRQSICDDDDWKRFMSTLDAPRDKLPDREWIEALAQFLRPNLPLFVKFKELVGCDPTVGLRPQGERDANANDNDDFHDEDYEKISWYGDEQFDGVDITLIRDHLQSLSFESVYPQFFINARDSLARNPNSSSGRGNFSPVKMHAAKMPADGDAEDQDPYVEFKRIFFTPRDVMPDDVWEASVYACLEGCPSLIAHLKEIVMYEVLEDDGGEKAEVILSIPDDNAPVPI